LYILYPLRDRIAWASSRSPTDRLLLKALKLPMPIEDVWRCWIFLAEELHAYIVGIGEPGFAAGIFAEIL